MPSGFTCPGCQRELAQGAVVCIDCGHDFRTGRKLRTKVATATVSKEVGIPLLGTSTRYVVWRDGKRGWALSVSSKLLFIPLGTHDYYLSKFSALVTDYAEGDETETFVLTLEGARGKRARIYSGPNEGLFRWLTDTLQDVGGLEVKRG